ncbi:hypothetical protein Fmac_028985 [Flemingia macrophylla]|uniref:DUF4220 domain-containing protein n=1 Tax=Flemingia macrophylla TaxID=520843 RepID=A0ABD1L969_9FABA
MVSSPSDIIKDRENFKNTNLSEWIIKVDSELKLMYDVFYTKAFANYGISGLTSRFISLTTTINVLVFYAKLSVKREYQDLDHIITYLLLIGSLLAEIFALLLVVSSEWTCMYITLNVVGIFRWFLSFVSLFRFLCVFISDDVVQLLYNPPQYITRNEVFPADQFLMRQANFLNMISNKRLNIKGNFFLANKLEELTSVGEYCVSSNLRKVIFESLRDKSNEGTRSNPSSSLGYRNLLLGKNDPIFASVLELHRTIITWHIATDLFYYCDDDSSSELDERKNCKVMSDYMFYLLVKQRQMLPVGAGLITLRDTVIEAKDNIAVPQDNLAEVSRKLFKYGTTKTIHEVSEMENTSVLFHACAVAKLLIDRKLTWKFVEDLWIEVMNYASAQCRVDRHAHQLREGPEFLSHVWLLQAHLGLLEQFQIIPRQASV